MASLNILCFNPFNFKSRESLYRELGLECLQIRRWYRKMIFFYKILNALAPKYMSDFWPVSKNRHYSTINQLNLEFSQFFTRTKGFSNSFFSYCIEEWNKLDTKIKNLSSLSTFKKALLDFCKTEENSLFNVHISIGVKYLKMLRLNFRHLNEHKLHHNFRDTINPLCCCNTVILKLKLPVTISCVAICFLNKEQNSLKTSKILIILY